MVSRLRRHSFSMIEIVTVMAIIFIMVAMIVGVAGGVSRSRSEATTKAKMEKMMLALQEHLQDRGYFPIQAAGNASFAEFTHTQTGRPYLEGYAPGTVYNDAWNRPFKYEYQAGDPTYKLWSQGKNTADAADDICSWKQH